MLTSLHIENIAVIEKIDITFNEGFNVLTGETGAGKSIIIDSIEMVLGERVSKDLIRNGATTAFVGAIFYEKSDTVNSLLINNGILVEEDGNILIQRELFIDGRSTSKINGRQITLSVLKEIGRLLVNIHGQHDNQALLYSENHINYLDAYANNEEIINKYTEKFKVVNKIKQQISCISICNEEKERLIETLQYQVNEIENSAIYSNEEEELLEQKNILVNSEKIISNSSNSYELINGNDKNACDLISDSVNALGNIHMYSKELDDIYNKLSALKYELDDIAVELNSFNQSIDYSFSDLANIETRLDLIYRLKRKYGNSIKEILEFYDTASKKLHSIEASDEELINLNKELNRELTDLEHLAKKLSNSRIESGKRLVKLIEDELLYLDMPKVIIVAEVKPILTKDNEYMYQNNGIDSVEFLISTNVGEKLKPLAKIASGGELSRIMLSIKNVFAEKEKISTLIFDEIDSGVSGKSAHKIGLKLRQVAKTKQVICVTHLAQIASVADYHYLIKKDIVNAKTFTDISLLDKQGRVNEIAKIMGGIQITDATLKNAEEMLEMNK